jgi:hypothetical protein
VENVPPPSPAEVKHEGRSAAAVDSASNAELVKFDVELARPRDLATGAAVADFLNIVLTRARAGRGPGAALVPWVFKRLPLPHSRRIHLSDLADFLTRMRKQGIDPLFVTGDDLLNLP